MTLRRRRLPNALVDSVLDVGEADLLLGAGDVAGGGAEGLGADEHGHCWWWC